MRILGIDPGSLHTGYGIIENIGNSFKVIAAGCITNQARNTFENRYHKIFSELNRIIQDTRPEVAALENVIYCNNTKVAIKLGEARGVAILAVAFNGLQVKEYSPKKIKQAVTGNGNASKEQVQAMTKHLLGLDSLPPPDTADALAAAICHINQAATQQRLIRL